MSKLGYGTEDWPGMEAMQAEPLWTDGRVLRDRRTWWGRQSSQRSGWGWTGQHMETRAWRDTSQMCVKAESECRDQEAREGARWS